MKVLKIKWSFLKKAPFRNFYFPISLTANSNDFSKPESFFTLSRAFVNACSAAVGVREQERLLQVELEEQYEDAVHVYGIEEVQPPDVPAK
ncbi:MAG TPA: hypothetical protein PKL30_01600 [Leptospiraceae bacterium]|nr:hypothetical protein [Leptospiraceae bacterium]HMW06693.1 hypothetical protein [Leptospiraceae bacterium]HMX31943.1 hypothetical protein [Leptospiraceae bacterium]HMY33614.1 hypothetical protein [Leptospiraceae bacterium]HMZ64911.1 hypothetical protein [Leptospiraceae bacterium]